LITIRPIPNDSNVYTIALGGSGGGGSAGNSPAGGGGGSGYVLGPGGTFTGWIVSGTTSHYHEATSWEPWFAWRPVKIEERWHWLAKIYRKKSYYDLKNISKPIKFNWTYGTIFDILKEEQDGTY
jgi:hypothetical protein